MSTEELIATVREFEARSAEFVHAIVASKGAWAILSTHIEHVTQDVPADVFGIPLSVREDDVAATVAAWTDAAMNASPRKVLLVITAGESIEVLVIDGNAIVKAFSPHSSPVRIGPIDWSQQ